MPQPAQATNGVAATPATSKPNAPSSEIELLRRAQVALQSRPREAFQLTQEHRRLYPAGEFAQERDALAIQALMRVGDTEKARDLATSFIRSYPSSPHAHRFREARGLD
jgi:outer membrane protein assembly factor BamD (BamD/ComL family)